MLTKSAVRQLGEGERPEIERLLSADPYVSAQVAERIAARGLGWWRSDGRIYGYGSRHRLEAVCWLGTQLTPVAADPEALAAFADLLSRFGRTCTSIVGQRDQVIDLWERLSPRWGRARDVRAVQPLLVATQPAPVPADDSVRLIRPDEIDLLFPASVAMYTEEVGVSPLDGGRGYRHRVAELVRAGRAYAKIVDDRVVFKADLAVVTRHTAQVQGVWTDPQWRGKGIATAGMAAVVNDALRRVAPTVSLYVNDYNVPARRAYASCGFQQVAELATVLF
ncbi:GNAT family N-acetyltransferase [Hamadaea tsunoensis]|uniref:GNAT family N-acetyltransferase n=1 Tax=Hamadaea tsunoensis TaxID=53368 RepID=UPI0004102DE3|nr:GNAT family N-acetyltransferase [Hamadaea tsunoensis]